MEALLEAADAGEELEETAPPTTPLQDKASMLKPATAEASEEGGSGDGDEDEAEDQKNGDGSDSDDDGTFTLFICRVVQRNSGPRQKNLLHLYHDLSAVKSHLVPPYSG